MDLSTVMLGYDEVFGEVGWSELLSAVYECGETLPGGARLRG